MPRWGRACFAKCTSGMQLGKNRKAKILPHPRQVAPVGGTHDTHPRYQGPRRHGALGGLFYIRFLSPNQHSQLNLSDNSMDLQRIAAVQRSASLLVRLIITPGKAPAPIPPMPPRRSFSFLGSLLSEGVKRNCHAHKDRNRVATVNIELGRRSMSLIGPNAKCWHVRYCAAFGV